jgi:hypothetical protein
VVDRGIVGLHEGGDHLRQVADAAPLVARQQLQGVHAARQHHAGLLRAAQLEGQRGRLGFGEAGQQGPVKLHVQVLQVIGFAGAHGRQAPGAGLDEGGLGGQLDRQLAERRRCVVDDGQLVQSRHGILEVGEVEPAGGAELQADGGRLWGCGSGGMAVRGVGVRGSGSVHVRAHVRARARARRAACIHCHVRFSLVARATLLT